MVKVGGRVNEDEMHAFLFRHYKARLTLDPLPEMYPLDRMVSLDGSVVGFAEFKGRTFASDRYPSTMVDAVKVWACIEHEMKFKVPAKIFFGFTDGAVMSFRPATQEEDFGSFLRPELSTPRSQTISANAGKTRPVVLVPMSRLELLGVEEGFQPSPRVKPPKRTPTHDPALTPRWTEGNGVTVDQWRARVTGFLPWGLHRNPHGHPLVWCGGKASKIVEGWVDVDFRDTHTPGVIPLAVDKWVAAMEHERIFPETQAWLTLGYADGTILMIRPTECTHPTRLALPTTPGVDGGGVIELPRDAFVEV